MSGTRFHVLFESDTAFLRGVGSVIDISGRPIHLQSRVRDSEVELRRRSIHGLDADRIALSGDCSRVAADMWKAFSMLGPLPKG